jgi:hypothetical protein
MPMEAYFYLWCGENNAKRASKSEFGFEIDGSTELGNDSIGNWPIPFPRRLVFLVE